MASEVSLPELHERDSVSSAAESESELSLLDLLIVLAERKILILKVTAVFALVAIVVSLLLPKRYTATVTLLPPQQNTSLASNLAGQLANLGGMASLAGGSLGVKSPNEMYVSMLKSRTVEDAMIQKFGLMNEYRDSFISDARLDLERHVSIDGSGKDGLIRISVQDRDPRRAAELANGYVTEFRALSDHLAITEASQRRLFFEQQLAKAKDDLARAEEAMKLTEQTTGIFQLDSQARALIESAAALRAQVAAKEVQVRSMQTFATDQNAQLIKAQQELESMRAQLARLGGSEDSENGLIVPKGKVPGAGLEYVRKLRDVKYYETIFDILARQFEIAKLDEAKEGAPVQIVDAAVPADKKSFPKRGLIVIGATLVGLIVGCIWALLQLAYQNLPRYPGAQSKVERLRRAFSFRVRPGSV